MAHTLYQWQTQCIEEWFTHQGRGVVQVVTGAGKTILALHAALALQSRLAEDLHIVIVVPKKFMLNQWKNTILSELPIRRDEIGFVGGGYADKHQYKVMLYVVNSARSRLSLPLYNHLMNDKPLLFIADECHHYASEENRKIFAFLDALPNEKKEKYSCLGLSATPKKGELEKYLGPLFYSYSFTEAIAHNVINRVAIFNVGLRLDAKQAKKYEALSTRITRTVGVFYLQNPGLKNLGHHAFFSALQEMASNGDSLAQTLLNLFLARKQLINTVYQRIDGAFDLITLLPSSSRILIFTERIDQSEELYHRLKEEYPSQVVLYHSELASDENTLALRRYQDREARIMVSCKALDEGLDIPSTDIGIILSTTSEQRQRIQRLGRILRKSGNKELATMYYFMVEHTIDDSNLLEEEIESIPEFYLSYDQGAFTHALYDEVALLYLDQLRLKGIDSTPIMDLLELGRIRPDWFRTPEELQRSADRAPTTFLTAYYSLMRSLALLRS